MNNYKMENMTFKNIIIDSSRSLMYYANNILFLFLKKYIEIGNMFWLFNAI